MSETVQTLSEPVFGFQFEFWNLNIVPHLYIVQNLWFKTKFIRTWPNLFGPDYPNFIRFEHISVDGKISSKTIASVFVIYIFIFCINKPCLLFFLLIFGYFFISLNVPLYLLNYKIHLSLGFRSSCCSSGSQISPDIGYRRAPGLTSPGLFFLSAEVRWLRNCKRCL